MRAETFESIENPDYSEDEEENQSEKVRENEQVTDDQQCSDSQLLQERASLSGCGQPRTAGFEAKEEQLPHPESG